MNDLISRQAAVNALQDKVFHNLSDEFYGTMQVLDELPPVDAEPVRHGRWKAGVTCSKCGYIRQETRSGNPVVGRYCPNCGAKMEGGVENDL